MVPIFDNIAINDNRRGLTGFVAVDFHDIIIDRVAMLEIVERNLLKGRTSPIEIHVIIICVIIRIVVYAAHSQQLGVGGILGVGECFVDDIYKLAHILFMRYSCPVYGESLMEYHVPLRPGLEALSLREGLQRNIDIMSEEAKKHSGEYQRNFYLNDIERWQAQLAECEIAIANADPDEPFLQDIDYFTAAAKNFKESRDRFIGEIFEKIEAVSDPAEKMRLVNLIPSEFLEERAVFVATVNDGVAHPEIKAALARNEIRHPWKRIRRG